MKTILNTEQLQLTIKRLAHQLIENHNDFANTVIIGLQPRGILFSDTVVAALNIILPNNNINYGKLDITFYRDDIRKELHQANKTEMDFTLENKKVIIMDDVFFTGRTIRSALDAIIDFADQVK